MSNNVPLIGVNISGLDLGWDYPRQQTGNCAYFAGFGMNVFRIPFKWELMYPSLTGPISTTYLSYLVDYTNACLAVGAVALLDMHNYSNYNGSIIDTGGSAPTTQNLCDAWVAIASDPGIKNVPNVRLGIMNEPHQSDANWIITSNAVTVALREAGINNTIHTMSQGGGYNPFDINNFVDSANNTIYEAHTYWDSSGAGTTAVDRPGGPPLQMSMQASVVRAIAPTNWPVFIGECGFDSGSTSLQQLPLFLAEIIKNADVYCGVTFFGGGQEFGSSYIYNMNPVNGIDQPQMAIIKEFTFPNTAKVNSGILSQVFGLDINSSSSLITGKEFGANYISNDTIEAQYIYNTNNPIITNQAGVLSSMGATWSESGTGPFPNSSQGSVALNNNAVDLFNSTSTKVFGYLGNVPFVFTEAMVQIPSIAAIPSGTVYLFGAKSSIQFTIWNDGFYYSVGNGGNRLVYQGTLSTYFGDGKYHHIVLGGDSTGCYMFVDGVKIWSSPTALANTGGAPNYALGWGSQVDDWVSSSNWVPGNIANVAFWEKAVYTENFTPPTDYYKGNEAHMVLYAPLNGNLNCYN